MPHPEVWRLQLQIPPKGGTTNIPRKKCQPLIERRQ